MVNRCKWAGNESMIEYHDKEWGVQVHSDKQLFEFLILEGAQAGLSWEIILKRRKTYKEAFANFDVKKISKFNKDDFTRLMNDPGVIRNRLKIKSTIENAKNFLEIQKEFGSFNKYIWSFVDNKPIVNTFKSITELPTSTEVSDEISKDLRRRGFSFVGSTIIYAFMQAVGLVNDHQIDCFRYHQLG